MPRRECAIVRPDRRRREARRGWRPGDSWDVALLEQRRMLGDLLRLGNILFPDGVLKPRGKPAADARRRVEEGAAASTPRRVYGFQSPFGRPPVKVPRMSGGQPGNRNARTHGRTDAAAKTARAERARALRDFRSIQRRLAQVASDWLRSDGDD